MESQQILDIIMVSLASIAFIVMIIHFILDIKASNKYWESMYARMDLFETSLKKEHDLLKKTQEFGEWLELYHKTMFTNLELEHTDFNDGVLSAAEDCMQMFMNTFDEYVGEVENDVDIGTRN